MCALNQIGSHIKNRDPKLRIARSTCKITGCAPECPTDEWSVVGQQKCHFFQSEILIMDFNRKRKEKEFAGILHTYKLYILYLVIREVWQWR